jgi:predicted aspartyl protease
MVPVALWKGSGSEGYYPDLALVDLGASYNFISQAVVDRLGLEVAKKRKPLPITTFNGDPLRATAVVR